MRLVTLAHLSCLLTLALPAWSGHSHADEKLQAPLNAVKDQELAQNAVHNVSGSKNGNHTIISASLFAELEELARIVDISYCVGTIGLGIQKPFDCPSRCSQFQNFELITVSMICVRVQIQSCMLIRVSRYRHGIQE